MSEGIKRDDDEAVGEQEVFREAFPRMIKRADGFHRSLEYNRITFAGAREREGEREGKSRQVVMMAELGE